MNPMRDPDRKPETVVLECVNAYRQELARLRELCRRAGEYIRGLEGLTGVEERLAGELERAGGGG